MCASEGDTWISFALINKSLSHTLKAHKHTHTKTAHICKWARSRAPPFIAHYAVALRPLPPPG